ncbi:hypothetical protein EI427_05025 [Flammeovirga pectinis]|uniref:DUF1735 domain-containing protein n=1 Tax=Flammeovirga pectinis TaxID=2494373 RepID=A0A3Q9FLV8_9BACT|nr:hypothetical protein [Flammeovirga pectinis]AZQ61615.1 hypothetical protein EI427_05025 [Flammeovirga pectinis]
MKKSNILYFILLLIISFSCKDEDVNTPIDTTSSTISSTDSTRVENGFSGTQGSFKDFTIIYRAPSSGINNLVLSTKSLLLNDGNVIREVAPVKVDFAMEPTTADEKLLHSAFNVDYTKVAGAKEYVMTIPSSLMNIQSAGDLSFETFVKQDTSDARPSKAVVSFIVNVAADQPEILFFNANGDTLTGKYSLTVNEVLKLRTVANQKITSFEIAVVDINQDTTTTNLPVIGTKIDSLLTTLSDVSLLLGKVVDERGNESTIKLEIAEYSRLASQTNTLLYSGPGQSDNANLDLNAGIEYSGYINKDSIGIVTPTSNSTGVMVEISEDEYIVLRDTAYSSSAEKQVVYQVTEELYGMKSEMGSSSIPEAETKYYIVKKTDQQYSVVQVARTVKTSEANIDYFLSEERTVPFEH